MTVSILIGDCRERMAELPDASVDSVVCDPPYHLTSIVKRFGSETAAPAKVGKTGAYARASKGFMGQTWDGGDVAFQPETWAEVLRVLKPGGFLLAFGGDRTFHRLAVAIEDAGFDYRGTLAWIFGSGFPKSLNVSRALANIPPCSCAEVEGHRGGVVSSGGPLGLGGAGVGTELSAVDLAGLPAGANGLGLEPCAESLGRKPTVQSGIKGGVGHFDPVMLGALNVTGIAEGQQVTGHVCTGEIEPKTLRNQVVDDQLVARPAVCAPAVASNDGCTQGIPLHTLVSPLLATPCWVGGTDHSPLIVGGHAGSGAIGSRSPTLEVVGAKGDGASLANEVGHGDETTAKRTGLQCSVCGGVIADNIPDGLGTALKPAMEMIAMARKPLSEKNVAANVMAHGTGALNVDGCRVEHSEECKPMAAQAGGDKVFGQGGRKAETTDLKPAGRWPANILHDGSEEVLAGFPDTSSHDTQDSGQKYAHKRPSNIGLMTGLTQKGPPGRADSGSAARFFYCAKASSDERGEGNNHPTVKPIALMQWLVRLITPPGGIVLDPFMGSGSTGIACQRERVNFIGCEMSPDYAAIAERRLNADAGMFAEVKVA